MNDEQKTKEELIRELNALRQRLAALNPSPSEQNNSEWFLKSSENERTTPVNILLEHTVVLDKNGRYLDIIEYNHESIDGHNHLIGKSLYEVQSREFADFCFEIIQRTIETGKVQFLEYALNNEHGFPISYQGHAAPLYNSASGETNVLWISRDITDLKKSEHAMKKSEERLRTVVNMLPDRAVILNTEGIYVDIVKKDYETKIAELMNLDTTMNIVGKHLSNALPQEFIDFCLATIRETLETNTMQVVEYDLAKLDGSRVYLEGRVTPWDVDDVSEPSVLWISRDITDRKETERALQQSEERLRTFVNLLPDRAVILNAEGVYTDIVKNNMDHNVSRTMNMDSSVIGKTLQETFSQEFVDFCLAKIREILETNTTQIIEYDLISPAGNHVYLEGYISPWNFDDEPLVLWISRDITDRKKTERALKESEERLRTFVNLLPDRAVIFNTEGRYVDLIKKHDGTSISQPFDVVGKTLHEVAPQEFADFCLSKIRETLEADTMQVIEYDLIDPAGNYIYCEGRITPWHVDDVDETRVLWITRDITERKKTEHELARYRDHLETLVQERTAELQQKIAERKQLEAEKIRQERLAAVGQLAAGIAHDFNNVMGVITLDSSLVLRSPNLTDRERSKLERIQNQARHAANLIEQILDFSRRSVREPVILDLRVLLSELVKFLQRTIPERIEVSFSYTKDDFAVNVDPTQFQQVITNLAVNARDAIQGNGKLSFYLSGFTVTRDQSPPIAEMPVGFYVKLEVTDTGQGIEAHHLSHIFEPFFTTKEVGKGTGLGLAQVHGIVHQHDGFISVESEVGKGTSFSIYFPGAQGDAMSLVQESDKALEAGQGETILLVEDNADLLEAISDLLETLDYRVLTATNGEEALAVFNENRQRVSLVLSDVVMPRMDGIELVRQLKRYFPRPKIIMMSGFHQSSTITSDIEHAVIEWLQKPLDTMHLAEIIQSALSKDVNV